MAAVRLPGCLACGTRGSLWPCCSPAPCSPPSWCCRPWRRCWSEAAGPARNRVTIRRHEHRRTPRIPPARARGGVEPPPAGTLPRHRGLLVPSPPARDHPPPRLGAGGADRRFLHLLLDRPAEDPRRHRFQPGGGARPLRLVGAPAPHLPYLPHLRLVPLGALRAAEHRS